MRSPASRRSTLLALLLLFLLAPALSAAPPGPDDERLDWWRDARFGMFIHWGLYAIPAGEWKGNTNHAEWILTTGQIPVAEYEGFRPQFNPVKFDADEWVRIAKDAGMKYIVITSKHHDGFCLFDSAHTDWDVMSTPFQRDIMKELAEACRREGLKICWYHSIMDWHHPDYLPRRGWEDRPADGAVYARYVEHLRRQVEELLTNYGDIGIMWFDGEWEGTWNHEYGQALYDLCRKLQPDVIVNNRVDKGRGGMAGLTADAKYAGDYGTPEQEIPETGLPGVDWETCMTMNRHWGYNKNDDVWKSSTDLIRKLVDIASKGGNFLLNVGPTAAGEFPDESVERLRDMGRWMKVNGESIYGTSASPFSGLEWGRCTVRADGDVTRLYLHVFDWPESGELVIPGLGNEFVGAFFLDGRDMALPVARAGGDVRIGLPPRAPDETCTVVVLEIEGAPVIYELPEITADSKILVRPLAVEIRTRSDALDVHYTLDRTDPTAASPRYEGPFLVEDTTLVKARSFHRGRPVSGVAEAWFTRVEPLPAAEVRELHPGLVLEVFKGDWSELPDFAGLRPATRRPVPGIVLEGEAGEEYVARRYVGYLRVERDDVYRFALTSDDGSRLVLWDRTVVDNDGLHGAREAWGEVALSAGEHPLTLEWFNKTGGAELELRWGPVGSPVTVVPPEALVR